MQAVQRGEELPGVRTIDDKPREGQVTVQASETSRPLKPWMKNKSSSDAKPYVAGLNGGNGARFVRPANDPRESPSTTAPPPVGSGDKLDALQGNKPGGSSERSELIWEPLHPEHFSSTNLGDYSGGNTDLPTLVSIDGLVFDVSSSPSFKVGTGYNALAGRDASRSLAVMTLKDEVLISDLQGCTEEEISVLNDWVGYFRDKKGYPLVGRVPTITRTTSHAVPEYP